MKPDADWFREMWLYYCRNLHVWDTEPIEWRGGCHRSMPEAYAKGRTAAWYPVQYGYAARLTHRKNTARSCSRIVTSSVSLSQSSHSELLFSLSSELCCGKHRRSKIDQHTTDGVHRSSEYSECAANEKEKPGRSDLPCECTCATLRLRCRSRSRTVEAVHARPTLA